jgi:hydroxymethylbilane synthase
VPLGATARVEGDALAIRAAVVSPDGGRRIEAALSGSADAAEDVGKRLAEQLLAQGARELL